MRIFWTKVISDLESRGVRRPTIALACEVSIGTVYNWAAGFEPRYHNGARLLELYVEQVGNEPPIRRGYSTDTVYRRTPRSPGGLQSSLPST